MNGAAEGERLPHSVGRLIAFALSAWTANARLYLALALGVFVAYAAAEYAIPAAIASTPQGQFKLYVLVFSGLFADAFVIAAVALGVAARAAGTLAPARVLVGAAVERWLPVIAVTFLSQLVVVLTNEFSGLGESSLPRVLLYLIAPLIWILWGILGLTGPFVALNPNRGAFPVIVGFARAFAVALYRGNLLRLCVLAMILILPTVLETVLQHVLLQRHISRAFFWANAPIDALTVGPATAIATAFALDFARRAGLLEERKPPRD